MSLLQSIHFPAVSPFLLTADRILAVGLHTFIAQRIFVVRTPGAQGTQQLASESLLYTDIV